MNWGKVQNWLQVGASVVIIVTGVSVVVTGLVGWLLLSIPPLPLLLVLLGTFLLVFGGSIAAWRRMRLAPIDNTPVAMAVGIDLSGERAIAAEREAKLQQRFIEANVKIQALEKELQGFGLDRVGRKYLKQTLDELPPLPVGFAKDFAGLLYFAYQKPHSTVRVELTEEDGVGRVTVPEIDRSITFPLESAKSVQRRMQQLVETAKNDSNWEARQTRRS